MRTISAGGLAKINQQYGIESIIIVRVLWSPGNYTDYAEKAYPEFNVQGRILQMSGLDDVVNINSSGKNASVTVTLSDHDGELKSIINQRDLHKTRVQVLQWFDGLHLEDAFVIFDGRINTPMSWKEGPRTLDFTILTLLEERELGFSPDESFFNLIPHGMLGQAWPLIFGTNARVKALKINEAPDIITATGFGIIDELLYRIDINDLVAKSNEAFDQAAAAYNSSTASSRIGATYNDGFESVGDGSGRENPFEIGGNSGYNPPDNFQTYMQYFNESQQYYKQFADYMFDYRTIQDDIRRLTKERDIYRTYSGKPVPVISMIAPRGLVMTAQFGDEYWTVRLDGNVMTLLDEVTPLKQKPVYFTDFNTKKTSIKWIGTVAREKFIWVPGGSRIRITDQPLRYVISLDPSQVLSISAKQQGVYVNVPPEYYTIDRYPFQRADGITVYATILTMIKPLTSYLGRFHDQIKDNDQIWDDDEIYVDAIGLIPGRLVDILVYVITTFSGLTYDPASFATARLYTDAIPMNHVVRDRLDCLGYMKEIAFQGKCALWINDNTVYIRYLPITPTPVAMIGEVDILEQSLEIFSTETEEVTTKFVANWKFTESQPEYNKLVYRYNILKYGLHNGDYNFFAFNDVNSVGWSARYWIMQKANVYKKLRFKTDLKFLKLESFDPVLIDMIGLVANTQVVGIVESSIYDSDNKEIELVIWVPVRWGEMDQFVFAYIDGDMPYFGNPADPGIYTGNPYQHAIDLNNIIRPMTNYYYIGSILGNKSPQIPAPIDSIADVGFDIAPYVVEQPVNTTTPVEITHANEYGKYQIIPAEPLDLNNAGLSSAYFGTVQDRIVGTSDFYKVQLLNDGKIVSVKQLLQGADTPPIPSGTPTIILKSKGLYYMQVPVWLKGT